MLSTKQKKSMVLIMIVVSTSLLIVMSLEKKPYFHKVVLNPAKVSRIAEFMLAKIKHEFDFNA